MSTTGVEEAKDHQKYRQGRLGRKDMHTLNEGEFRSVKELSNNELQRLQGDSSASERLRTAAANELRKRIDPLDQDTTLM